MTHEEALIAGRYQLEELIGRGSVSEVYRGIDTQLNRTVTVKLLKSALAQEPTFQSRLRQEAGSAARMAHPGIVRVFDVGEEVTEQDGEEVLLPYVVAEYAEGTILRDLVSAGPLEQSEALRIIDAVLAALEYAHRAGVIHRDVSSGNIIIADDGSARVMDFGIARAVSEASAAATQTTALSGTARYFSPEQARGETVDARTDLYSVGVVLFEMLTGRPPFSADTPVAVAYQHISEKPARPSTINPKVSPAVDTVVLRALEKSKTERYQTAAEFRADVEIAASGRVPIHREPDQASLIFGSPTTSLSSSELALRRLTEDNNVEPPGRRPPMAWIWAGILSVAVIAFAVMYWAFAMQPTTDLSGGSHQIPDVASLNYDDASKKLASIGADVSRMEETSTTVPAGKVIRTAPEAGETIPPNTQVRIYVSAGQIVTPIPGALPSTPTPAQSG